MKILSNYVKKTAFYSMTFAVLGLWLLQIVFSYIGELDSLTENYGLFEALTYIFYKSPYYLEQFIPTGALLGAVVGLGLLANNSELTVMRASGISNLRIVGWVMQPATVFVVIALAINQFILPISNQLADMVEDNPQNDLDQIVSVEGFWTTRPIYEAVSKSHGSSDTVEVGKEIIYIGYADTEGNLGQVKRWNLDNNGTLISTFIAKSGKYVKEVSSQQKGFEGFTEYKWQLKNSAYLSIDNSSQSMRTQMSSTIIDLPIAPDSIHMLTKDAEDLSLTQLYAHTKFMHSQDKRSISHELAFWLKLFSPFSVLSLVLVACSFVFGSLRTHSLGSRVVVALLFGLFFSYIQDLTGFIALATGSSPLLMVLLPICICASFGLALLNKRQ